MARRQGSEKGDPAAAPHLCNLIVDGIVLVRLGAPARAGDLLTINQQGLAVPVGPSAHPMPIIGVALDSSEGAARVSFRPFAIPHWPIAAGEEGSS
jgi:hypothetical protein